MENECLHIKLTVAYLGIFGLPIILFCHDCGGHLHLHWGVYDFISISDPPLDGYGVTTEKKRL